jgi:hypothetical protein
MSRFTGSKGRGAEASLRKVKRTEAEARNALTPPEKRRANRKLSQRTDIRNSAGELVLSFTTPQYISEESQ